MTDVEHYSSISSKYEHAFGNNAGLISFIPQAAKHLPPHASVLDAGCGTGKPVAVGLAALGHHITGIDISDAMIELSRKAVPDGDFSVADMQEYAPPESTKFDAIFNILSLFLQDREGLERIVKKWPGWLKEGGLLCISTMGADDLDPELRGGKYDADGLCARDITMRFFGTGVKICVFTKAGWLRLLEENGFEVLETKVEWHHPPEETDTDNEPHYYIIARKK